MKTSNLQVILTLYQGSSIGSLLYEFVVKYTVELFTDDRFDFFNLIYITFALFFVVAKVLVIINIWKLKKLLNWLKFFLMLFFMNLGFMVLIALKKFGRYIDQDETNDDDEAFDTEFLVRHSIQLFVDAYATSILYRLAQKTKSLPTSKRSQRNLILD